MARDSRSSPLRWLHISDLPLRAGDDPGRHADRTYEQNIVLEALIRSFDDPGLLGKLKPDVIFCTGDIAHGGKAEEYQEALRALDDLCEVTGVEMAHWSPTSPCPTFSTKMRPLRASGPHRQPPSLRGVIEATHSSGENLKVRNPRKPRSSS